MGAYSVVFKPKLECRGPGSNRYGYHYPQDFKSCASANSATPARAIQMPNNLVAGMFGFRIREYLEEDAKKRNFPTI